MVQLGAVPGWILLQRQVLRLIFKLLKVLQVNLNAHGKLNHRTEVMVQLSKLILLPTQTSCSTGLSSMTTPPPVLDQMVSSQQLKAPQTFIILDHIQLPQEELIWTQLKMLTLQLFQPQRLFGLKLKQTHLLITQEQLDQLFSIQMKKALSKLHKQPQLTPLSSLLNTVLIKQPLTPTTPLNLLMTALELFTMMPFFLKREELLISSEPFSKLLYSSHKDHAHLPNQLLTLVQSWN